jgi:hypothetical protein
MGHQRNNQSCRLFAYIYCNVMRRSPQVHPLGVHPGDPGRLSRKLDEVTEDVFASLLLVDITFTADFVIVA